MSYKLRSINTTQIDINLETNRLTITRKGKAEHYTLLNNGEYKRLKEAHNLHDKARLLNGTI